MNAVQGSAAIYCGAEYQGSYASVLGSQFWKEKGYQKGTVCYQGIRYYNVPIAYDLVRNDVLTKSFQNTAIRLEPLKLNYFIVDGHTFVHFFDDSTGANTLPEGIYEVLVNSNIKLYAKRTKAVQRSLYRDNMDTIVSHNSYFLFKDGTYFTLSDSRDLINAFPNEKDAMKAFWKSHRLNFKKDPETFITETVSYWATTRK